MASWVDDCSGFDDTVHWEKLDYKTFAKILYMGKIDVHHASSMMAKITELREKYYLHMRVERYVSDETGVSAADKAFTVYVGVPLRYLPMNTVDLNPFKAKSKGRLYCLKGIKIL